MRSETLPLGLVLLLVAGTAARVALAWERLPPTMASHFSLSGEPDGWMPRSAFFVLFALVLGGSCLLMALLPALIRRLPTALINVPHREYWLAPPRREQTQARLGSLLAWYAVVYTLFLAVVLELTLRANLRNEPLENGAFSASLGLLLLGTVALVVRLYTAFRRPPGPPAPGGLRSLRGLALRAPVDPTPRLLDEDQLWEKDPEATPRG